MTRKNISMDKNWQKNIKKSNEGDKFISLPTSPLCCSLQIDHTLSMTLTLTEAALKFNIIFAYQSAYTFKKTFTEISFVFMGLRTYFNRYFITAIK